MDAFGFLYVGRDPSTLVPRETSENFRGSKKELEQRAMGTSKRRDSAECIVLSDYEGVILHILYIRAKRPDFSPSKNVNQQVHMMPYDFIPTADQHYRRK